MSERKQQHNAHNTWESEKKEKEEETKHEANWLLSMNIWHHNIWNVQ